MKSAAWILIEIELSQAKLTWELYINLDDVLKLIDLLFFIGVFWNFKTVHDAHFQRKVFDKI